MVLLRAQPYGMANPTGEREQCGSQPQLPRGREATAVSQTDTDDSIAAQPLPSSQWSRLDDCATILRILRTATTLKTAVRWAVTFEASSLVGMSLLEAPNAARRYRPPGGRDQIVHMTSTRGSVRAAHTPCWSTRMRGAQHIRFRERTETALPLMPTTGSPTRSAADCPRPW